MRVSAWPPILALLAAAPACGPGEEGAAPSGPPFAAGEGQPSVDEPVTPREADEVVLLRARLLEERGRYEERIAALESELVRERTDRTERELEWFEYNRALALFGLDDRVEPFPVDPDHQPALVEWEDGIPAEETELQRHMRERAEEIRLSLETLLRVEEVRGLDLIEGGSLGTGGIGPVVFRLLDDRGRLAGGLSAKRLRLEGSLSAHTVTIVLENGFESRGGERVAFRGGVRRIVLPFVDPEPWMDAMPELFPPGARHGLRDDGRWKGEVLRGELNRLLRASGAGSYWRLRHLGGVVGDELVDVHLDGFDAAGRLEERIFADRLAIRLDDGSVRLELADGVTIRGGERIPFLDGRRRLFLTEADPDAWRGASLPGVEARR